MYYAYVIFNTGKNNVYLGGLFKTKPTNQQAAKALKLDNIRKDGITIDSFGEPGGNMCIIV